MTKTFHIDRQLLAVSLPLLLLLGVVFLAQSAMLQGHSRLLSIGITIDLLLTIPLIYFLLVRKTKIPNTTVVPVLVLGVVIGSYILPARDQFYLDLFIQWGLPVVEISVLAFVIYKVRNAVKLFRSQQQAAPDFYTALNQTCYDILPAKLVPAFATEVAVIYYSFFSWRKRKLRPHEFSYHRDSGTLALFGVLIFLIAIETVVFHLLLTTWSAIAAWVVSGLSIYTALQVFGWMRSLTQRPISIENNHLYLRYGMMNETTIALENIASIEVFTRSINQEDQIKKLSPLGDLESHNMLITLKEETPLHGIYGMMSRYRKLAFYVDQKEEFKTMLETALTANHDESEV